MSEQARKYRLENMYERHAAPADYAGAYFARLGEVMAAVDVEKVGAAIAAIEAAAAAGRTIYLIANGGSAAVASHFMNDAIAGAWKEGLPPVKAMALTDNVESMTAISNDSEFANVFVNQLRVFMQPGDVVLAMSVSGNSPNVVRAVEWAKAHGGVTVGWTGFDGGRLAELADYGVHMPTTKDEYGPVEDMFSVLMHAVMTHLTLKRGKQLHH